MREVKIIELTLRNFKGVRNRTVTFNQGLITHIMGDNAEGKTTTMDAFLWLTSDKNSEGDKNFGIKTQDEHGRDIPKLEHEVIAKIMSNGHERELKKVLREKWVKKRGSIDEEFSGNTVDYYIDSVPYKEKDYNHQIEVMFGGQETSKLLSNVNYFNTLDWKKQREILINIVPTITNDEVFELIKSQLNEIQLNGLKTVLNQNKDIELFKREIASKKKQVKDDLKSIPERIDEVNRSIVPEEDLSLVEKELGEKEVELEALKTQKQVISSKEAEHSSNYSTQISEYHSKKSELEIKRDALIRNAGSGYDSQIADVQLKIDDETRKKATVQLSLNSANSDHDSLTKKISKFKEAIQKLSEQKTELESKSVDFNQETSCPTCKRDFDTDVLETQRKEALYKFNQDKVDSLETLETQEAQIKESLDQIEQQLVTAETTIMTMENSIKDYDSNLQSLYRQKTSLEESKQKLEIPKEANDIQAEIEKLVMPTQTPFDGTEGFKVSQQMVEIERQMTELRTKLTVKSGNDRAKTRISELDGQLKLLNNEMNKLESAEYSANVFTKAYTDRIEGSVNSLFSLVKFKLFETQVNGEEVPTCKCMIDGVVYKDLNTASKINAGVDIISTLSPILQVKLPLFIDNKESVSEIHNIGALNLSQLILLEKVKGQEFKVF